MNPLDLRNLSYALHHPAEFSPAKTWAAVVKCFHSGMVNTTPPAAMPTSTPTAKTLPAPVPPHGQSTSLITGSHHRHGTGSQRGYVDPLILWTLVLMTVVGLVICWQLKRLIH